MRYKMKKYGIKKGEERGEENERCEHESQTNSAGR